MSWQGAWPDRARRIVPALIHASARFTRPLTMGVRAVILDRTGGGCRVFLVRHSYVAGWHLPGGAVEPGETAGEALAREVREECSIALAGPAHLFGLYFNRQASRRDHVAVFQVDAYEVLSRREPDWEIVEAGFHEAERLPEGTTAATRARLAEVLHGRAASADW